VATLTELIIARIVAMTTVQALVGKNPTFDAEADQYAVRDGILHTDDPYPGVVVDLQTQTHEKDLSDRGGLIHATVAIRAISFSKPEAWALRTALAFDGSGPNDDARTSGLDAWRDISAGLWGMGLDTETIEHLDPADGEDRDVWIVESLYLVDYREQ